MSYNIGSKSKIKKLKCISYKNPISNEKKEVKILSLKFLINELQHRGIKVRKTIPQHCSRKHNLKNQNQTKHYHQFHTKKKCILERREAKQSKNLSFPEGAYKAPP